MLYIFFLNLTDPKMCTNIIFIVFPLSRWLRCLDFSKVDDWTLLSGSEDHTVMVWDLKEESEGRKVPQKKPSFASVYLDSPNDQGYFLSMFLTDANTVQVRC